MKLSYNIVADINSLFAKISKKYLGIILNEVTWGYGREIWAEVERYWANVVF
jgi:hypothetical protein